jgi:hypothetical protein
MALQSKNKTVAFPVNQDDSDEEEWSAGDEEGFAQQVTRTFVCIDIYLSQLLGVCSD